LRIEIIILEETASGIAFEENSYYSLKFYRAAVFSKSITFHGEWFAFGDINKK
jgi:hypothetical protein